MSGTIPKSQVPLLLEDVGGRGSLRTVGHLPGRLDVRGELLAKARPFCLEDRPGSVAPRLVHPTMLRPKPRPDRSRRSQLIGS